MPGKTQYHRGGIAFPLFLVFFVLPLLVFVLWYDKNSYAVYDDIYLLGKNPFHLSSRTFDFYTCENMISDQGEMLFGQKAYPYSACKKEFENWSFEYERSEFFKERCQKLIKEKIEGDSFWEGDDRDTIACSSVLDQYWPTVDDTPLFNKEDFSVKGVNIAYQSVNNSPIVKRHPEYPQIFVIEITLEESAYSPFFLRFYDENKAHNACDMLREKMNIS